jgi:hypothetical protein
MRLVVPPTEFGMLYVPNLPFPLLEYLDIIVGVSLCVSWTSILVELKGCWILQAQYYL